MNYDPYTNQQARFHRTDPTGRYNRLQEHNLPKDMHTIVEWVKVAAIVFAGVVLIIAAAVLRGM